MYKILRKLLVLIGVVCFVFNAATLGCPSPNVTALSVNKGINTEVINLTITGSKFHKSTYVKLTKPGEKDIIAENVKVVSATQVTCTLDLRDKTAGEWDVIVGNIGTFTKKEKPTLIAKGFIIEYPDIAITSMKPSQANIDTVLSVNITGKGFRTGIKVILSNEQMDIGATKINVNSPANLTCEFNLKGAAAGSYKLRVVNDDGKTGVLDKAFTVINPVAAVKPAPTIIMVNPEQGSNNGQISVQITGNYFDPKATVKLQQAGQEPITGLNIKFESAAGLACTFDLSAKPAGKYNVIVTNPDNQSAVLKDGFSVTQFTQVNPTLKPVFFDYDDWKLRPDQIESLNTNIGILKNNPRLYILLGGHADERGTREYNLDLSAKRAEVVKKYLVEHGISGDQIVIYAYGKDYPAKKGTGEENWSYNRRVDILVFDSTPSKDAGIINP